LRKIGSRRKPEHFLEKACPALDAGWTPVSRGKCEQIETLEPAFDSIKAGKP
jgi:hypothetical protein